MGTGYLLNMGITGVEKSPQKAPFGGAFLGVV
jgi:hypothetical protein